MLKIKKLIRAAFDPYLLLVLILMLYKIYLMSQDLSLDLKRDVYFINAGLILVILAPAYCFSHRTRKIYLYLCDLFFSFLLVADLLYCRYFGTWVSVYTFFESSNLSGLGPSILTLCDRHDGIYIIDLFILPLIFRFTSFPAPQRRRLFLRDLMAGAILISYLFYQNYDNGKILRRYSANDTLATLGPLGFHVADAAYFIKDRNIKLTDNDKAAILNWYAQKNSTADTSKQTVAEGKNLIVIQVESLQNFVIGKKVNNQEITPNLNKLVKDSLYFTHFYPQTVDGNSSDAELLINTSLYPIDKGSTFFTYPLNEYISLPLLLKKKGYQAVAIHADEAGYWNRNIVYPNLGFNQYFSIEKMTAAEELGMGLSDEAMFRQSLSILESLPQPFYSFIITLSSHYPFMMPDGYNLLDLAGDLANSHVGNYLQSVHYADKAIGQFVEDLKDAGLLQNTVIAIYGDHDGMFERDKPEIERVFANKPISEEEWTRVYVPVPLLIYNSGLKAKTADVYGGQVDFLPTISYLMGVNSDDYRFAMGNNLLTTKDGYAIIPSGDYITRAAHVSPDKVENDLSGTDLHTLHIANLIIRTNFFSLYDLESNIKPTKSR